MSDQPNIENPNRQLLQLEISTREQSVSLNTIINELNTIKSSSDESKSKMAEKALAVITDVRESVIQILSNGAILDSDGKLVIDPSIGISSNVFECFIKLQTPSNRINYTNGHIQFTKGDIAILLSNINSIDYSKLGITEEEVHSTHEMLKILNDYLDKEVSTSIKFYIIAPLTSLNPGRKKEAITNMMWGVRHDYTKSIAQAVAEIIKSKLEGIQINEKLQENRKKVNSFIPKIASQLVNSTLSSHSSSES